MYPQIFLLPEGILKIMGLLKQIAGLKYTIFHLVRERSREREGREGRR